MFGLIASPSSLLRACGTRNDPRHLVVIVVICNCSSVFTSLQDPQFRFWGATTLQNGVASLSLYYSTTLPFS